MLECYTVRWLDLLDAFLEEFIDLMSLGDLCVHLDIIVEGSELLRDGEVEILGQLYHVGD